MSAFRFPSRSKPVHTPRAGRMKARPGRRAAVFGVEAVEERQLLSTFTVSNLNPAGDGSLLSALIQANANPGPDTIDFQVSGTVRVGRTSLPAITGPVTIDGATAPGYAGTPAVTVDFQGTRGFRFNAGSDGSVLRGLSVVRACDAGVTLNASFITVEGNYVGLLADGSTPAGNRGDGIRINPGSNHNVIGHEDPVTGVSYYNASGVSMQPVSGWQGIRGSDTPGSYLITGTSGSNGLLYDGPISGVGGTSYTVNVPGAVTSSVYGPDNLEGGNLRLVGSYRSGSGTVNGFLYEGTVADLGQPGNYRTIAYPNAQFTYVHSTMGGLAVGNADGPTANLPIGTGHAFLYGVSQSAILGDIVYPGAVTTTAYGIWHNGRTNYTICGGYSLAGDPNDGLTHAFLVDYDASNGQYSNWTSFDASAPGVGRSVITHFEGISSVEAGVYTLSADSAEVGNGASAQGWALTVRRLDDNRFGEAAWVRLNYPGATGVSSSNSIYGNQVVGIAGGVNGQTASYQATVNVAFQLSNVIAANAGNGIGIYGANDNRVAMNYIGTDATGTVARGNTQNGVLITNGASGNMIGGQATGGNDPTGGVFVRPPQGNLISANRANGVLITNRATRNKLSGNFVGTNATGNAPLGNRLDGVAIVRADGNALVGCLLNQDPFVFYNVLSGNGGNGLRVTDSNNIDVQANFMGVGANNATVVPNRGNGLLVSGSSRDTHVGGVIPLGNVISGNAGNGIEVRDRASGFLSFNTFAGVYAFGGAAPNGRDGILITSTGGNNTIRTSIVAGNLGNGIQLAGGATGVQVTETAVGTNTGIQYAIPNQGHGILIGGHAHGNAIGGFQPSVEPHVTISGNRGYGIAIVGNARDNVIYHSVIGTNAQGTVAVSNGLGGILLGPGTMATEIGGPAESLQNTIQANVGNGLTLRSTRNNNVSHNRIIANQGYGVYAEGPCDGTTIRRNVITANTQGDVDLSRSRGIEFIP